MSEEENKREDFLTGHADILNSILKKDVPKPTDPSAEKPAATPSSEAPVKNTEPVPAEESAPEEAPVKEEEPIEEEPAAVEEPPTEEDLNEDSIVEEVQAEEEPEVTTIDPIDEIPPVVEVKPAKLPPKPKKPSTPAQAAKIKHDALEEAEVKEVLTFINKYVKPAGIAIAIVCIIFLANSLMKSSRHKKEIDADTALSSASNATEYQAIIDNYAGTPSAPLAMLGLAQEKFNASDVAGAEALYAAFLKDYPKHEMAIQANYNQITCLEAQAQYDKAAALYGEFKNNHPSSHLAPMALLAKGRCLEATKNYAAAKPAYEDLIAFYPESGWIQLAQSKLRQIESKLK